VTVTQTHEGREEKGKVKILLTPKSKSTETGGSQEEGGGKEGKGWFKGW
jgi:hypothetical protein